jgi:hypothetical protein
MGIKEPWVEHHNIWKSKSAFTSFLRGGIRRALWNRSPIKLEFIKKNRKKIANPNPRGKVKEVWGATCALCGNDFPLSEMNVDHITGNHSLNDLSDIQTFVENIVCVSFDDLQFVDKACHKIKSHCEKQGISFEEARMEKIAIDLVKKGMCKDWLESKGVVPASSQAKRRIQIVELLKEDKENE